MTKKRTDDSEWCRKFSGAGFIGDDTAVVPHVICVYRFN